MKYKLTMYKRISKCLLYFIPTKVLERYPKFWKEFLKQTGRRKYAKVTIEIESSHNKD